MPISASLMPSTIAKLKTNEAYLLATEEGSIKKIIIRLIWDDSETRETSVDMDGSLFLLGADGFVTSEGGFCFFNQAQTSCGSATYIGHADPLDGEHHLEEFFVNLNQLPDEVQSLLITLSMDSLLHDGAPMPEKLSLSLLNEETGKKICAYQLPEQVDKGHTVLLAKINRQDGPWTITPMGQIQEGGLTKLVAQFGIEMR